VELADALARALRDRPFRFYPALLSTEADALAWARAGAPQGAIVTAGYQASPRGRAGFEWDVGDGLAFSLVLRPRPRVPATREGWVYTVAVSGLADALGKEATIEWPDGVRSGGVRAGAVGAHVEVDPLGVDWAVVNVLIHEQDPGLVARVVDAIEARLAEASAPVLAAYLRRCDTIGRDVVARLVPLGPGGPEASGRAVSSSTDGSLIVETAEGRRLAIPPQSLGLLEQAPP
jgi:BirA family biotin operon repressor/biotin-[acetyl-CoA-carboxylase] ligase